MDIPDNPPAVSEVQERQQQMRAAVVAAVKAAQEADPTYLKRPLMELNKEAVGLQKAGNLLGAVAAFGKLFERARVCNLYHTELHVCHTNRAAALLALELWDEALWDAQRASQLALDAMKRDPRMMAGYTKSLLRKAAALIGLTRYREATLTLDEGLRLDPLNSSMQQLHAEASRGVLGDLLEGKGMEMRALPAPEASQRITSHPFAAPLHRIRTDNMLPTKLLTPFQAESDHNVKDTYNYMTIQTDIRMPRRHFTFLEDSELHRVFQAAISQAVAQITADEDIDCRVLNLGAGAGLHAMMALRAGAHHVTAAERWLYLSLACKEALVANKFPADRHKVVYKRPTDLALIQDVPIVCNLLICNIFDEGLLTCGLIPAVRHSLDNLLTPNAIILPASATVFMQAAEVRTKDVCGLDMSAADLHRWHPVYLSGAPLADDLFRPLSGPLEVWHFDFGNPPQESARRTLDVEFTQMGRFNAVVFWFELHLGFGITVSTKPGCGLKSMGPAVQYLAGQLSVEAGMLLPVLATHNTVRMHFDIEEAEYMHLTKTDAAFPADQFSMLADVARNEAYNRAICRVVKAKKAETKEAHVLDVGSGTGLFAMMAAKAGADSVVANDLSEVLCTTARRAVAANDLGGRVSVVHRDAGLLERGHEMRRLGANVVVADFFDSGLFGNNFTYILELLKKRVLQPNTTVIPNAATMYCMGLEMATGSVCGFDFSSFDQFRWDKGYEACYLDDLPHKVLTKPAQAFEYFFEGMRKGQQRDHLLKLEVTSAGTLNALAIWFDLHLDEEESITTGKFCCMTESLLAPTSGN
ncbi:hypothetical protein WJX74_009582 [Apatococcus lobatus]|uniref:type I protein arginine methyltransferase n=1 Tax=Apatococcus lobatus TaxID=904363 RepID=A0AAW1QWA3_9CHLO